MKTALSIFSGVLLGLAICDAEELGKDSYEIISKTADTTVIQREIVTPSGDWMFKLTYRYGKEGKLNEILSQFVTLSGYDPKTEDFTPTGCVRSYDVSEKKVLTLKSETITDAKSGNVAERTFFYPEVEHWWSLTDVPPQRKADNPAKGE